MSTILNLGTKLIRWTSSIDCDRVGVYSLAVCQCGDRVEVFFFGKKVSFWKKGVFFNDRCWFAYLTRAAVCGPKHLMRPKRFSVALPA